jgi:EAL domain-containing protein (putative c-di-GMP-specific phosphodiesterase class I)
VLTQALETCARHARSGDGIRMRVDLSSHELVDDQFVESLAALLEIHAAVPSRLVLGFPESALATSPDRAEEVLRRLRTLGVRIGVNGFGAGPSSIAQLLRLPIDDLVLDGSFVASIDEDLTAQAVLAATVELGRTLGMTVLVGDVPSPAAVDVLGALGVDQVIGGLGAAPKPAEELSRVR